MKETTTTLVDNKDGGPADESLNMRFEGVTYTWDLNEGNAAKFRKVLKPWLDCAEVRGAKASTNGNGVSVTDVRTWAAENGYEVSSRGRIPAALQEAYDEAHA